MGDSFPQTKRRLLQQRISGLIQEYKAVDAQRNAALEASQRLKLKRQLEDLEQQISEAQTELQQLSHLAANTTGRPGARGPSQPEVAWAEIKAHPELLVGQTVGTYSLAQFLGAGGSGMVYRASHLSLTRDAALKIIYPLGPAQTDYYPVFERGFRALDALDHPNIVKIFDCGRTSLARQQVLYVGMEYVAGQPLDTWSISLGGTSDALTKRLDAAITLTEALAAAHEAAYIDRHGLQVRGVLHGDIKPANVLVNTANKIKLTDFLLVDVQRLLDPARSAPYQRTEPPKPKSVPGPSAAQAKAQHKTSETTLLGTPGFMSPEQERGILTTVSDVYSLGITLCYLFLPVPPSPDLVAPLLVKLGGARDLPPTLTELLQAMMKSDAAERPGSMKEVAQRLRALQPSAPPAKSPVLKRLGRLFGSSGT